MPPFDEIRQRFLDNTRQHLHLLPRDNAPVLCISGATSKNQPARCLAALSGQIKSH